MSDVRHSVRNALAIIKSQSELTLFSTDLDSDTRKTFESTLEELDRIIELLNTKDPI